MNPKTVYTRLRYDEALNFPGHMEIRILKGRERFRLQQGVALVWTLVNGSRSIEDIHSCIDHLLSFEAVVTALQELQKIKLIRQDIK